MQKTPKGAFVLLASFVIVTGIALYACKKSKQVEVKTTANNNTGLQSLAETMGKANHDNNAIKAAVAEYKALNAQQLDRLNTLRKQYELKQLDEKFKQDASADVSLYESEKQNIQHLADVRLQANQLAMERHGKPYNRFSTAELDDIIKELMVDKYARVDMMSHPANSRANALAEVASCSQKSFNSSCTYREGSGPTDCSYISVKPVVNGHVQSDCDWAFYYCGNYTYMDSENLDSDLLLESFGNKTAMTRQYVGSTLNTIILLGANRVWFFCGGPNGVNIIMHN